MNEVTRILSALEQGNPHAAEQLLPLVYEELRKLAAQKMAQEAPGQTLQPTALVHEAYLRLVGGDQAPHWDSRGHFFAAAAEAMRRILVDQARRRAAQKRGGNARRIAWDDQFAVADYGDEDLLALDEALGELQQHDPQAAGLVKLRYFSGLSHQQAAAALGVSRRVADRLWAVAKAWLYQRLQQG
jgi:RNA polymerase sigma factor (TIGR02999 family)